MHRLDPMDGRLLDEFQRDFPIVPAPFAVLGAALGIAEADVIARLVRLKDEGKISRVGATVRPNVAGASTLAAMAVPEERMEEVAALVGAEPGVNHSYQREDEWNLWFVAAAANDAALRAALARLEAASGLAVLDLRLMRPFTIDLGFSLKDGARAAPARAVVPTVVTEADRPLLAALSRGGVALEPAPWARLAARIGWTEAAVMARVAALVAGGVITRLGVIVRHRSLGWTSNAMVVWKLPEAQIEAAGQALAQLPGVTLCYQRNTVPGVWPYALYSMIHGRTRAESLAVLDQARALPELAGAVAKPLFSTRCFKQSGALIAEAA